MTPDPIRIVDDPFPSDAAMQALWLASWGNRGRESFAQILSRSLAHVGALDGVLLVGFVNVATDGGVHAFLLDTCVDRAYQRRGIATRLVERATALARERGAEWLHVDFEPALEPFYRACGFRPTLAGVIRLANT